MKDGSKDIRISGQRSPREKKTHLIIIITITITITIIIIIIIIIQ